MFSDVYFNPRGYVSLDFDAYGYKSNRIDFNPRGYVSLDRLIHYVFLLVPYFNPRGYVSLDKFVGIYKTINFISIHEAT